MKLGKHTITYKKAVYFLDEREEKILSTPEAIAWFNVIKKENTEPGIKPQIAEVINIQKKRGRPARKKIVNFGL